MCWNRYQEDLNFACLIVTFNYLYSYFLAVFYVELHWGHESLVNFWGLYFNERCLVQQIKNASLLSLTTARILADSGTERLPCSSALWKSRYQHPREWFSCGKIWTIFKVRPPDPPSLLPHSWAKPSRAAWQWECALTVSPSVSPLKQAWVEPHSPS